MNREEFKKFVLKEAEKYIFSNEEDVPAIVKDNVKFEAKAVKVNESKSTPKKVNVTLDEIKNLAKEIGDINKSIDFDNPLISDSDIVSEGVKPSDILKRDADMEGYNKNKNIHHAKESEGDKWKRMLNYNIPGDNER